jgi:hypothetical protein
VVPETAKAATVMMASQAVSSVKAVTAAQAADSAATETVAVSAHELG